MLLVIWNVIFSLIGNLRIFICNKMYTLKSIKKKKLTYLLLHNEKYITILGENVLLNLFPSAFLLWTSSDKKGFEKKGEKEPRIEVYISRCQKNQAETNIWQKI